MAWCKSNTTRGFVELVELQFLPSKHTRTRLHRMLATEMKCVVDIWQTSLKVLLFGMRTVLNRQTQASVTRKTAKIKDCRTRRRILGCQVMLKPTRNTLNFVKSRLFISSTWTLGTNRRGILWCECCELNSRSLCGRGCTTLPEQPNIFRVGVEKPPIASKTRSLTCVGAWRCPHNNPHLNP